MRACVCAYKETMNASSIWQITIRTKHLYKMTIQLGKALKIGSVFGNCFHDPSYAIGSSREFSKKGHLTN